MVNKAIDRKTIEQWVDPNHRHNVFDHWAVERFEYVYKIIMHLTLISGDIGNSRGLTEFYI